ncbi:MAG: hypothetical protein R3F11_15365 [Verrucomicrobiales bacterium]
MWISSIGSSPEEKTGKLTAGFGASDEKIGPSSRSASRCTILVDEPILLIKTAWGGKSINTDFRSPSGGPFEFRDDQIAKFKEQGKDVDQIKAEKAEATGHYYRLMVDHVKHVLGDIKRVYPLRRKGRLRTRLLVWFRGWNDMVDGGTYADRAQPGGYDLYA